MIRTIILGTVMTMALLSYSQSLSDTIDPLSFNHVLLEKAVYDKVNEFRATDHLNNLVFNVKLQDAAKDQCDYIDKTGKLTHEQDVPGKKTVQDRIEKYTGVSKFAAAENVAKTYILKPSMNYDAKGNASMSTTYTYEQAATFLFNAWKQSEFHRKNMLNGKYVVTGIAINFNAIDKSIAAVQVFARFGS